MRVIARVGVGLDSIDLPAAQSRGIVVTTTPGANEAVVADHAVSLMLAMMRRVVENDASVRRGEWNRMGDLTPYDVDGATVGLIGLGKIGRSVARRLMGFPVHVIGYDPAVRVCPGVERVDEIAQLLTRSDVVSLHLPLTPATRHLIGPAELSQMRPDSILINTARGGLIDEEALVTCLERGTIRAAALDVFENEPPRGSQLLSLPNVVLSPHIGGLSPRSVTAMLTLASRSVVEVLTGQQPHNAISYPYQVSGPSQ